MKRLALLLLLLLPIRAVADSDTINTVPSQNASFMPDLQTFLRSEDAQRFGEMFQSFIVSGCLGGTSVNQTHTPTSCIAYPGGWRATDTHSITYPITDGICWTIVQKDRTGNITGPDAVAYTRIPNTHYLVNCTAVSQPQTPANAAFLMKVTLTASAITAVQDLRVRAPVTIVSLTLRDPEPPAEPNGWVGAGMTPVDTVQHSTVFTLPRAAPVLVTVNLTQEIVSVPQSEMVLRLKVDGALLAREVIGPYVTAFSFGAVTLSGVVPMLSAGSHTVTVTGQTIIGTLAGPTGYTSIIAW